MSCYTTLTILTAFYLLYAWNNDFKNEIWITTYLKDNSWAAIVFSSIIAMIMAIRTVSEHRQIAREKNSLEFEQKYQESDRVHQHKDILRRNFEKLSSLKIKEITNKNREDLNEQEIEFLDAAGYILNEWERAANAINHNIFDEHLLYKAHASTVLTLYKNLSDYIHIRQQENSRFYINYVMLVTKWQIRRGKEEKKEGINYNEIKVNQKRLKSSLDKILN